MTPPRIPRHRSPILADLRRSAARHWQGLAWALPILSERLLPWLMVFTAGFIFGMSAVDRRAEDEVRAAEVRAVAAKRRQLAAEQIASQYALACGPRLSSPIRRGVETVSTETGGAR